MVATLAQATQHLLPGCSNGILLDPFNISLLSCTSQEETCSTQKWRQFKERGSLGLGVVVHTYNSSSLETELGGWLSKSNWVKEQDPV
jgi:hypothetical protein